MNYDIAEDGEEKGSGRAYYVVNNLALIIDSANPSYLRGEIKNNETVMVAFPSENSTINDEQIEIMKSYLNSELV
jgi:hypothetical protein